MEAKILTETLFNIWPMLTIFLVVMIAMRITYIRVNHEKFIFYKEFMNLIFIVYAMLLFQLLTDTELNTTSGINLVPFTEILRYKVGTHAFYMNVIGNILIFLPFGYFVSSYVRASKISHILFISLLTSFTIEFIQHYIGRSFDIDDILLNVVGSILGFLLYIAINAIEKHLPRFFRSTTFYNIVCLILFAVLFVYFTRLIGLGWF